VKKTKEKLKKIKPFFIKIGKFIYLKHRNIISKTKLFVEFIRLTKYSEYVIWTSKDKTILEHYTQTLGDFLMKNVTAGIFINIGMNSILNQPMNAYTIIGYTTFHWLMFKTILSYRKQVMK